MGVPTTSSRLQSTAENQSAQHRATEAGMALRSRCCPPRPGNDATSSLMVVMYVTSAWSKVFALDFGHRKADMGLQTPRCLEIPESKALLRRREPRGRVLERQGLCRKHSNGRLIAPRCTDRAGRVWSVQDLRPGPGPTPIHGRATDRQRPGSSIGKRRPANTAFAAT